MLEEKHILLYHVRDHPYYPTFTTAQGVVFLSPCMTGEITRGGVLPSAIPLYVLSPRLEIVMLLEKDHVHHMGLFGRDVKMAMLWHLS